MPFVGIAFADSPPIEPEAVKVSFVMHYSHHNYPIFYPMIPPCEHGPQICTGSQLEANCCQPFQNKCRDHGIARLVQVHSDGTFTYSLIYGGDAAQKLTSGDTTVPKSLAKSDGTQSTAKPNSTSTIYILGQNYPNPVCGKTLITYSIPARAYITLKIYDLSGHLVKTLIEGSQNEGTYTISWNCKTAADESVTPGIYFYRLTAGDFTQTKKMMVLR